MPVHYAFKDINDKEFNLLRDIVFKESGINLTEKKKTLMQTRLVRRLRDLGLDNYYHYYEYLKENYEEEIVNLINCITTNKTDFFREPDHFEFIKKTAMPKFESSGKKSIRIWSAGCSTGQEPYSIAITLSEYFINGKMPEIKILATDIDTNVLNCGVAGIYKEESMEGVDRGILRRYFIKQEEDKGDYYYIKDSIKQMVYYRRLNLLDSVFPMKGKFDMIFCRNVVIYFDNNTRDDLVRKFHNQLSDDGYYFAGHSENLSSYASMFNSIGNTIYRKVL